MAMTCPFAPRALPRFVTTTGQSAPLRRIGTFGLAVGAACAFSLGIAGQVLTFRTRAWLSFAPPTCRMTLGQSQDIPQADPGGRVTPRFCHRLISFRHFISGLLALVSLNRACQNHVPAIPQRSQPLLLTMAACGGLRSAPTFISHTGARRRLDRRYSRHTTLNGHVTLVRAL